MGIAPSSLDVIAGYASGTHKAYLSWQNNTSYIHIQIREREGGGSWTSLGLIDGDRTSYTRSGPTTDTLLEYQVRGWYIPGGNPAQWTAFSNTAGCTCYTKTVTETLGLDDSNTGDLHTVGDLIVETLSLDDSSTADALAAVDVVTETLSLSDTLKGASTLRTDYSYFLGTSDGELFLYDPAYKGDNSIAFSSSWRSKTTDFSEKYPDYIDMFKTVYGAELKYVDKDANTAITLYYSTDGGDTWTSGGTRTAGDGDGTTKRMKFYFIATGEFFDFKIEHASASNEFQWVELIVDFIPAGEIKEIS